MSLVQSAINGRPNNSTGTTMSVSWPSATTAGNLLVLGLTAPGILASLSVPSGWVLAKSDGGLDGDPYTALYYIENAASRSGAETITWSGATLANTFIAEYSGVIVSGSLDKTASNTSLGVPATNHTAGTTANTSQAAELCVAAIGGSVGDGTAMSYSAPQNSYVIEQQRDCTQSMSTIDSSLAFLDFTQSSQTTESTGATASKSSLFACVIATFKLSSPPGESGATVYLYSNSYTPGSQMHSYYKPQQYGTAVYSVQQCNIAPLPSAMYSYEQVQKAQGGSAMPGYQQTGYNEAGAVVYCIDQNNKSGGSVTVVNVTAFAGSSPGFGTLTVQEIVSITAFGDMPPTVNGVTVEQVGVFVNQFITGFNGSPYNGFGGVSFSGSGSGPTDSSGNLLFTQNVKQDGASWRTELIIDSGVSYDHAGCVFMDSGYGALYTKNGQVYFNFTNNAGAWDPTDAIAVGTGGNVRGMTISDGGILFGLLDSGQVIRCRDRGTTWENGGRVKLNNMEGEITTCGDILIVVTPTQDNTGVIHFISTDSGQTWN